MIIWKIEKVPNKLSGLAMKIFWFLLTLHDKILEIDNLKIKLFSFKYNFKDIYGAREAFPARKTFSK